MSAVDNLMLDAKQAILDEQHRRRSAKLQQEGRWSEAMKQFHVTLGCASELLNESLYCFSVLEQAVRQSLPAECPLSSRMVLQ